MPELRWMKRGEKVGKQFTIGWKKARNKVKGVKNFFW